MADKLTERPDFGLRAGAQAVELFREFGGRARYFITVTHINVLQETRNRRRRGLLILCGRAGCQAPGSAFWYAAGELSLKAAGVSTWGFTYAGPTQPAASTTTEARAMRRI